MSIEADAKRVFLEVLEAPAERRAELLGAACARDGDLLRRVSRLIKSHELPGPENPARIGRYRLIRVVGTGSTGVVYEAEQENPHRRVAVKVLRWCAGDADFRRFELEAEALGTLRHPGIAQVYEAGRAAVTRAGAPDEQASFIAMELVPGSPGIVECALTRALRQRLELVALACDAVQAAHEQGIIHRDLKPGNILVGPDGLPKIIDFGVARMTGPDWGPTLHTRAGEVIGTPGYMSPEQCAGDSRDAGVRSDVYSLGAILFQVATGALPHELRGLNLSQAVRIIQERDPAWPKGRGRTWRDLGAVCLKALARAPDARYAAAGELAAEIRRVLAGERVAARPPRVFARVRRWARRHPVVATGAACCAIAVLSLTGALAGVYALALRPDHTVVDDGRRFVILESRAGHRLHTWDAEPGGQICFDAIVDGPSGRMVLVGFQPNLNSPGSPGRIEAFDAAVPGRRLWSTANWPLTPPGEYSQRREIVPAIDCVLLADILPGLPGPELVVVHTLNPFSPAAIRVYDLSGRLDYEAWHDGAIYSVHWLPLARRLLVCGLNSEARWDERGIPGLRPCYPFFIAAIEPAPGRTGPRSWLVEGGRHPDDTLRWYQWLGPVEQLDSLRDAGITLRGAGMGWDQGRCAAVMLKRPEGAVELSVVIDADGAELSRWTNDGYKAAQRAGTMPEPGAFALYPYSALPARR